jgi:hypothetical protein
VEKRALAASSVARVPRRLARCSPGSALGKCPVDQASALRVTLAKANESTRDLFPHQRLASNLPETMPCNAARSITRPRFSSTVDLDGCGATRGAAWVRVGAALPSRGRSRWFEPNHAHSRGRRGQRDWSGRRSAGYGRRRDLLVLQLGTAVADSHGCWQRFAAPRRPWGRCPVRVALLDRRGSPAARTGPGSAC